jgi:hypothetical protein
MPSGTDEPECLQPRRVILSIIAAAVTSAPVATCADDAPEREATTAVTRATIHAIANGAATARREQFLAATLTSVGAPGVTDWANSIAVN